MIYRKTIVANISVFIISIPYFRRWLKTPFLELFRWHDLHDNFNLSNTLNRLHTRSVPSVRRAFHSRSSNEICIVSASYFTKILISFRIWFSIKTMSPIILSKSTLSANQRKKIHQSREHFIERISIIYFIRDTSSMDLIYFDIHFICSFLKTSDTKISFKS